MLYYNQLHPGPVGVGTKESLGLPSENRGLLNPLFLDLSFSTMNWQNLYFLCLNHVESPVWVD